MRLIELEIERKLQENRSCASWSGSRRLDDDNGRQHRTRPAGADHTDRPRDCRIASKPGSLTSSRRLYGLKNGAGTLHHTATKADLADTPSRHYNWRLRAAMTAAIAPHSLRAPRAR